MNTRSFVPAFRGACVLLAVLPGLATGRVAADGSGGGQGGRLADLAAQILTCSVHPCLGQTEKDVRTALHDAIVSDEVSCYSDLRVAYPSVRGHLQGVVEWDFGGTLDAINLMVIDFPVESSEFLDQLELALPGCEMERDSDGLNAWSCSVDRQDAEDADVFVYVAPGLVILEIDP